ncbi:MAG: type II toxin-antitoxin system RelE/ParE family toxin [Alphaproteobacteria bacterium]|jgi:plasmid stabilization system protein ParE|nr:type II toxin-antitoxin system RelE/ParE family toxin [Alphaproteobacteria bacterium]
MNIAFTRAARQDLIRIRNYIGTDSPQAASRMAVELIAACDRLELFPERGRPGLVEGTRELTSVWPYVIVYRIKHETIEILRIWHGAQGRG